MLRKLKNRLISMITVTALMVTGMMPQTVQTVMADDNTVTYDLVNDYDADGAQVQSYKLKLSDDVFVDASGGKYKKMAAGSSLMQAQCFI